MKTRINFLLFFTLLFCFYISCKNNKTGNNNKSIVRGYLKDGEWIFDSSVKDSIKLIIKDSLINEKFTLISRIDCYKYISINSKKNKHKDSLLLYNGSGFDFVRFDSISQKIEFVNSNKVCTIIRNRALFDTLSKKDKGFENTHSIIDIVFLLKGNVNDLYLIIDETTYASIWALYTMNGNLLWYELECKSDYYSTGDNKIILKKYGINETALEEDYLNKCKLFEPLF